jgi:CBS-domain-containing membrane protein
MLMTEIEAGATGLEELAFSVPASPCAVEFSVVEGELVLRVV